VQLKNAKTSLETCFFWTKTTRLETPQLTVQRETTKYNVLTLPSGFSYTLGKYKSLAARISAPCIWTNKETRTNHFSGDPEKQMK